MSKPFSIADLALLHEIGAGTIITGQPELCALIADASAEIERLQGKNTEQREALKLSVELINRQSVLKDENTRMRAVFSKCAVALGNGAAIDPRVSIGFLELFPLEVHAVVRRLTENKDSAP